MNILAKLENSNIIKSVTDINELDIDSIINDGFIGLRHIAEFKFK